MVNPNEIIEKIVQLIHTIVPGENLSQAVAPAIACVVVGLVLTFSGARLIRGLIILTCLAAGGYAGWFAAKHFNLPAAVGIVGGAGILGAMGLVLARLWIAGISGVLAGFVALSAFAFQQDVPTRFEEFARTHRQPKPTAVNEFPLGEPGSAAAQALEGPVQVATRFVIDLHRRDDPLLLKGILWVGGAVVIGTIIGLIAARGAMVFWTSLAGLVLVVGGSVVLVAGSWPGWREVVLDNVLVVLGALSAVWLGGVLVQLRNTRTVVAARKPGEAVVHISTAAR